MKKQSFLPILALVLGIAASAFTPVGSNFAHTDPLWHFTGSTVQGQTDQEQYEPTETTTLPDCQGNDIYCVIEAPEDLTNPGFPDLSNLQPGDIKSRKVMP